MDPTQTPTIPGLAGEGAAAMGGLLGGAARRLTRVRSAHKPLHPKGDVLVGMLARTGSVGSGVPWLDSAGTEEVLVRLSRAIGLPAAVPDIHGLAVRVPVADGHADVLLASTGTGRLTRFLLTAGRTVATRPLTTLLPYRSPHGPLLIAARPVVPTKGTDDPDSPLRFELMWAHGLRSWVPFADLVVDSQHGPDPDISFDPVLNPLPGLVFYDWVRRLREPAYLAAREESHRG